ncbi:MAG: single-stranded DNA-binding protein [Spirochaetes bacterium]|nr:single-stranded DNA-binding protein [Spirochaetota bacterium]
MADVNVVVLVGRLTRDAELKYTNSGIAVCKFAIAINTRKKQGDQWVDEPNFFDVVFWGKAGEAVNQYLTKGKLVAVEGELRQNRWEQDGQSRSKVEISANNVRLLGGGSGGPQGANSDRSVRSERQDHPDTQAKTPSASPSGRGDAPPPDDFNDDIPF